MATIDSLSIQISSESSRAAKSIDSLVGKLGKLNKGLQSVNTGGLRNYARDVGRLSAAVKSLNGIKVNAPNLGGLTSQLEKLSKADFSGLSSGTKPLKDFASALRAFDGLSNISIPKLDTRNINSVVNSLGKMQNIDTSKVSQISGTLSQVSSALSAFSNLNLKESGINSTISALSKLLSVDFGKFNASSLDKVTRSIGTLGKLPDVSSSVNRLINSLAKLVNAGAKVRIVAAQLPVLSRALRKTVIDLRSLGNISESTSAFVHAVAQLAATGDKAQKAAAGMDDLKDGMMRLFGAMKDAPRISENTIRMTEALAKLSNTSGKVKSSTGDISSAFDKLSSLGEKAAGGISSAFGKLSSAGTKAAGLVSNAAQKMLSSTKGAFSKLSQVASRAASAVSNSAKSIMSAFSGIGRSSSGVNTASHNLGTLIKTVAGLKAIKSLWSFGNEAVGLGSDITEVENVVDTAFGSMADQAYDFASVASEQFGLSELAAKQYSGTMMAMLKSSGVTQDQAAKMSVTLAGLAGDLASFYNLDTDEAFYKLRAAISGETEPMKALGVNMNIVNLEAYAMSQGITKAYKDMTLAEQSILRYNYLLAKTGDAQSDFARTSASWANQTRLLRLNLESIKAVIGQGLITALLPAIQLLNKFMAKLMQAAKVFRDFMYVLTGKKITGSQKGIVNDLASTADYATDLSGIGNVAEDTADSMDDIEDGAENASSGMEEATDSAKKLKKALSVLPFDELNQLTANLADEDLKLPSIKTPSTSASKVKVPELNLDDTGISDLGDIFDDAFEKIETEPINKWAAAIRKAFLDHDWKGLGEIIAEMINIGLRKIYDTIKAITPKVEDAMRALAQVINSLVDKLNWDLLGRTIGAGINLIVKAFNALVGPGGIDFENLGRKLSVGVRGLLDEVEWRELGNAIGNGFMIAWRIADGFIEDMWRTAEDTFLTGWAELGNAIGETVVGIFDRINFVQIARVLTEGFKGILETATYALNTLSDNLDWIIDKINAGLKRFYDGIKWDSEAGENMGQKITAFADAVVRAFNKLLDLDFGLIGQIIGAAITDIVRAFNLIVGPGGIDFELLGSKIAEGLRGVLTEIPWKEFGNALGNGFMAAWNILGGFVTQMSARSDAGISGWQELGRAVANAIAGIFEKINFGEIGRTLAKAFNGIFDSLREFTETMEKNGTWNKIANNISHGLNNAIRGIRAEEAGKTLSKFVTDLLGMLLKTAEQTHWKELGTKIGHFLLSIEWGTIFGQVFSLITEVVGGLFTGLGGSILEKAEDIGTSLANGFNRAFEKLREFTESVNWNKIADSISAGLNAAISGMDAEAAGQSLNKFVTSILGMLVSIAEKTDWKTLGNKIGTLLSQIEWGKILGDVFKIIGDVVGGLLSGFAETTAGKAVIALTAAFGALKLTGIGIKLLDPIVRELTGTSISAKIAKAASKAFGKVTGLFKSGGAIYDAFSGAASLLGGAFEGLTGIAVPAGASMAAIVAAIVAVVAALVDLWKTSESFRDTVKNAFGDVKESVAGAFNKIKEAIGPLWESIKELGKSLYDFYEGSGLKSIVELFASLAATLIGKGLSVLIDTLGTAFSGLASVLTGAIEVISGVLDVLTGIFTLDFDKVVDGFGKIGQGISDAFSGIKERFLGVGEDIINGLFEGIQTVISTIGTWLKEHVVDPLVSNVKNLLGIHSPSTVFAKIGEFIIEGLLEGISNLIDSVIAIFIKIKDDILAVWDTIKAKTSEAWEGIKAVISTIWESIKALASTIWDAIKTIVTSAWDGIQTLTATVWNTVKTTVEEVWNTIKVLAETVFGTIKTVINSAWDGIEKLTATVWGAVKSTVSDIWNGIKTLAKTVFNTIKKTINSAWDGIKDKTSSIWNAVKTTVSEIWDTIKTLAKNTFDKIKDTIKSAWDGIKNTASTVWNSIKTVLSGVWETIKTLASTVFNTIKTTVTSAWDGIQNITSTVWNGIKTIISTAINGLGATVSIVFNGIRNTVSTVWNGLTAVTSAAWNGIKNAIRTPINAIIGFINGLLRSIQTMQNGIASALNSLPSANVPGFGNIGFSVGYWTAPQVPYLAKGGLATRTTPAVIGEAGAEAVLPLTNARTMSMIASAITSEMDFGFGGGYESPFFENIALYTQKTANWCANIHDELTAQGKVINKILSTANDLLESDTSSVTILGAIQAQVKNFQSEASAKAEKLMQVVSDTIKTVGNSAINGIKSGAESVKNSIQVVGENVKAGIESIISLNEQAMQSVTESINSGIEILNNSISQSVQSIMDGMNSGYSMLSDSINNGINSVSQSVQAISNDINNVGNMISQSIQFVSNDINSGVNNLINSVSQAAQSLSTTMSSGFSQISSSISSLSGSFNSAAAKTTTSSTTKAATTAKQTSTSAKTTTSTASKITNSLTFGTKEAQQAQTKKVASEALNNQIKKIQEGGKNEIKVATENIKKYSHPSDVARRISEETARINKSVAERIEQLKKSYGLKTGGLVTSPIFTQMGEMSKPEAVLPLTDHRAMSMISESILSNAPAGGGLDKESLIDAIVEGVVMAMMNNSQNQPPVNVNCYATLKTESDEVLARAVARGQSSLDYRMNPTPQF